MTTILATSGNTLAKSGQRHWRFRATVSPHPESALALPNMGRLLLVAKEGLFHQYNFEEGEDRHISTELWAGSSRKLGTFVLVSLENCRKICTGSKGGLSNFEWTLQQKLREALARSDRDLCKA
jgi:hypothetical protein